MMKRAGGRGEWDVHEQRRADITSTLHKFQPCHHFLSLHLLPCHFSLLTPPTSHFLPTKGTKLSHPPCLSPFACTLPVLLLLLLSALLPHRLSFHSHSSSAHLRPSRERPLPLDVFAARRAGSLSWLCKGRCFVTRKCSRMAHRLHLLNLVLR